MSLCLNLEQISREIGCHDQLVKLIEKKAARAARNKRHKSVEEEPEEGIEQQPPVIPNTCKLCLQLIGTSVVMKNQEQISMND